MARTASAGRSIIFWYPLPPYPIAEIRTPPGGNLVPLSMDWQARNEKPDDRASSPDQPPFAPGAVQRPGGAIDAAAAEICGPQAIINNCLPETCTAIMCFPMRWRCFFDRPGIDFEGGESRDDETRPRMHCARWLLRPLLMCRRRLFAVNAGRCEAARPINQRPLHHVTSGQLMLGLGRCCRIIFHDAS